jgi:hypothetical protein
MPIIPLLKIGQFREGGRVMRAGCTIDDWGELVFLLVIGLTAAICLSGWI